MIEWISSWAETIIIAVIIGTIIEIILPEGNNKKYIKVVIGIYILFTIISPVISNFTGKSLAVSDIIDLDEYIDEVKEKEISQNMLEEQNNSSIRDIYISNLKLDMKSKLQAKGYIITSLEVEVGYDENYTLNKISLSAIKEENYETNIEEINNKIEVINIINDIEINISEDTENNNINENDTNDINSNLSSTDKKNIKEYLSSVYEINEKDINVN